MPFAPDDDALVQRLRAGDPTAFDLAYTQHQARIYGFLYRLVGSRPAAEDLAQETWLRLARRASTIAAGAPLVPWLLTVARNLAVSHLRWRVLDTSRLALVGRLSRAAEPTLPDAAADGHALHHALERGLSALAVADREVLLLVGVEGLSHDEAATVLGVDPAALRQRLARARKRLAEAMDRERVRGPVARHAAAGESA